MSDKEGLKQKLLTLMEAYCNDTLSPSDLEQLEELLLTDPNARRTFRKYLGVDSALRDFGDSAAASWLHGSSDVAITRSNSHKPLVGSLQPVHPALRSLTTVFDAWRFVPRRWTLSIVAALTLVGLATAMTVFYKRSGAMENGTLDQVTGDVRVLPADGQARLVGSNTSVGQGDTVRTKGSESSAVVSYTDGTRLTLVGNTSMTCGDCFVIHHGTLAASIMPQPRDKPLLLATPSAKLQVLGTRFQIDADEKRTTLSVRQGRVRVIRIQDGTEVEVASGKCATIAEQSQLQVKDIPELSPEWEEDFEVGLPADWKLGEWVTEGLMAGSRGAVRATADEAEHGQRTFSIRSHEAWLQGLFTVHKDSHLHVTLKMDRPNWINVFLVTRTSDPHDPRFSGNYLFDQFPSVEPGRWQTLTFPLGAFKRLHRNAKPLEESVPFQLIFTSTMPDRGLVIDRIWVTPTGSGQVEVVPMQSRAN